jgi:hypothetical protein
VEEERRERESRENEKKNGLLVTAILVPVSLFLFNQASGERDQQ